MKSACVGLFPKQSAEEPGPIIRLLSLQFSLSGSATARLRPRGLLKPLSVLIEPVTIMPCLNVHLQRTSALPSPGVIAEEPTSRKSPHPPSKDLSSTGLSSDEPNSPMTLLPDCASRMPAPPSPGQSQ